MTQLTVPLHDTHMPTIDVAHAADYLGVSERTIRRLVASRAIGHRRLAGLIRFTQGDLDRYVENISVCPEAPAVH
jgi:excisionase family DNA binding protein